ncbi:putative 2-phosphosulfolactate phosphatase [Gimesia alba]|uniref:Probable 2-phosphosulfolactate phosphatase n=1 Tax=Gimesia alba TaxID=2527973 RepID=A0A517REE5_9PLAN|nr:2-phosphosulfolactate phosphatase [Gimesia alba]QDT42239.1 putative 2-phosphosulfolactate phosphatase [Gimesia alba]
MPTEIRTCLLPLLSKPEDYSGSVAVILDILRASSTISFALNSGATSVIPCEEIEEAQQVASELRQATGEEVLLGGERMGVMIEGFDLDNSPARYPAETVAGKQIVFTTSNGTRALKHAIQARRILIGSFLCLDAVVNELKNSDGLIYLVCAGTDGSVTGEDCLCAGAIAAELQDQIGQELAMDDSTRIVVDHYRSQIQHEEGVLMAIRASLGGRNLIRRGFEDDIRLCSERGLISAVPEYDHQSETITLAAGV